MSDLVPFNFMGKVVGQWREHDRVYIAHRREEHIFRKYNGLGLSFGIIDQLKHLRCRRIILLLEKNNGTTLKFEATPDLFLQKGTIHKDGEFDFQRILNFNDMVQEGLMAFV